MRKDFFQIVSIVHCVPVVCAMAIMHNAAADVVTDWNRTAMSVVGTLGVGTGWQSRVMASAHVAMFDAVNGVEPKYASAMSVARINANLGTAEKNQAIDAATSVAAHRVLSELVPLQKARLDQALKTALEAIPDSESKALGMRHGQTVANDVLAMRRNDGSEITVDYVSSQVPGRWTPTPPDFSPASVPQFGRVKTFVLRAANQFALPGPALAGSANHQRDFTELLAKGVSRQSSRTADESESALFWNILTLIPFNDLARRLSAQQGLSVHENARLFALLHMVGTDSQIAAWHWKYHFDAWRPVTAIRSSNVGIALANEWAPMIYTPPHPEYPSGHTAYGGAVVEVLKAQFGQSARNFNMISSWTTLTRNYSTLDQVAQDIVDARVWAGIHFRTSNVHGNQLGREIAKYALSHAMKPL